MFNKGNPSNNRSQYIQSGIQETRKEKNCSRHTVGLKENYHNYHDYTWGGGRSVTSILSHLKFTNFNSVDRIVNDH